MYADNMTKSMELAISETNRRREIQQAFNEKHGITPQTIKKGVRDVVQATMVAEESKGYEGKVKPEKMTASERKKLIAGMEKEMKQAAKELNFERAAELRDIVLELKAEGQ